MDDCDSDCCASAKLASIRSPAQERRWRQTLWLVLAINAAMFAIETGAGLLAHSAALQADALDFFGDSANYALSLSVLGLAPAFRARAALIKGATMAVLGMWVLALAAWRLQGGIVPEPHTMGIVGGAALAANIACLALLTGFRLGDANMRSVWICSRNDVIGNLAVLLAAAGVFGTGSGWPDITVAVIVGGLALTGAGQVVRQARAELRAA